MKSKKTFFEPIDLNNTINTNLNINNNNNDLNRFNDNSNNLTKYLNTHLKSKHSLSPNESIAITNNSAQKSESSLMKNSDIFNSINNTELPLKIILQNLKLKIFRLIIFILIKTFNFFLPPLKPSKEEKISYIKK